MDKWNNLSMTERAELMRIYRSNGISSISLMRDHYNKHDNGGDIQPSDATFRATLTNPVNSYRSNAPAGIGDAAITKATGLLNPITAATLTATPLGAISKINAAAKAYKAAKIANPIIASTIGASSTSAGLAGYLDSRPDKKLSRDIEDKDYVGEAIQQLTTLEQSRRDRIQEAARYYQNIQDRAKIGATVAGAGLGAYGIYKAIDSKKAFGGNIYDGKGTKSNQMNVSFPYKINPENISSSVDDYRYHAPEYIDNNTSLKEDTKRERLSKFIQAYNINHNNWKEPYTDSLINISKDKNIEPEDLAKVIASESSFDYTQKNSESTAYGLIQETQPNLSQRYKDDPEYKEKVMAEYLNKNRRVEDQFHDIRIELDEIKRLTKGRKLTAGDIKYNLLAPHSNRANLISETSWKNLTKKQKDSLTFGKSTYQDYIDLFNRQMERAFKEKTE
jgi:hypothetical protein